jgi:hypothetical protein
MLKALEKNIKKKFVNLKIFQLLINNLIQLNKKKAKKRYNKMIKIFNKVKMIKLFNKVKMI